MLLAMAYVVLTLHGMMLLHSRLVDSYPTSDRGPGISRSVSASINASSAMTGFWYGSQAMTELGLFRIKD
jgi:hypothetical protein